MKIAPGQSVKDAFYNYIVALQNEITIALEEIDGKAQFIEDAWTRPEGGGGHSRVLQDGAVFEKAGVNISAVEGPLPASMQAYFKVQDVDFFATGLSLVIHPHNPHVPTVHANWRYFEMYDKSGAIVDNWFGGGLDLTPYYLYEEDAQHFHQVCYDACAAFDVSLYDKYKARCDEYFYNAHRGEARGIGGLFWDYHRATDQYDMPAWFKFQTGVASRFLDAYLPIVLRRQDLAFAKAEKDWQEIRRGRYVEFNLVHDKGTLFGLKTNGRIESILMSLPPTVQWRYDHHPEPGSREAEMLAVLKEPKAWIL